MIRFLDGPAVGVELRLLRTPIMLRVVRSPQGRWDALDQPGDTAKPRETIHVYRLASRPSSMHIRAQSRSASGMYINADYMLWPEQPTDAQVRDDAAWGRWCDSVRAEVEQRLKDVGLLDLLNPEPTRKRGEQASPKPEAQK